MMLLKCCIQYVSKFGKLSSGHRTGKCQFSFQSQRKPVLNNLQTTLQCSFLILVRLCSKSFKVCFSIMLTRNFQMYKLDLEKVEEPEFKLTTFIGSQRKQGNSSKTSTSLTTLRPVTVPDHLTCLLRKLYTGQELTVKTLHEIPNWFKIGKRVQQGCILSPYLFNLYAEYIM